MSAYCPVCALKTSKQKCEECGLIIERIFLNNESFIQWFEEALKTVPPKPRLKPTQPEPARVFQKQGGQVL